MLSFYVSPPPFPSSPVLVDAAFFLAILLYSLVRPIHLAAWWYPILFYIQVRIHVRRFTTFFNHVTMHGTRIIPSTVDRFAGILILVLVCISAIVHFFSTLLYF